MAREGYLIVPVQFDLNQYTPEKYSNKAINNLRKIWKYIPEEKLKVYLFNHAYSIKTLIKEVPKEMMCIICKATMYKIAEKLCKNLKADGVAVGENLELLSKTNLSIINRFIRVPIFRPLTKLSRYKVKDITRRIGVYEDRVGETLECTVVPKEYTIRANYRTIMKILKDIDWDSIVNKEYGTMTIKEVR